MNLTKRKAKKKAKEKKTEDLEGISTVQVEALAVPEGILLQEICTRQFALSVSKNAKFHSSLQKAEKSSAKIAIGRRTTDINSDFFY
jgi:hypothetical protein